MFATSFITSSADAVFRFSQPSALPTFQSSNLPVYQSSNLPIFTLIELAYALLWVAALAYAGHARSGRRWMGWVATGTTAIAWGLLTAGLVGRGLAAGHWPLTNRYEFALCFAWATLIIYLLLETTWRERRAGTYMLGVALLVATYAVTRPSEARAVMPLLPALRSAWLQVHVLSSLVGYGACGVAAGLGLMRLMKRSSPDEDEQKTSAKRFLATEEIDRTLERTVALGFPWLTLGILSGAIWAQNAWGRYWDWDPKETWALVTWLWYLLILHVRPLRSWRGRRLAGLVVIGFGVVLFTFVGVPWLVRVVRLESLHGF
jgi:cytochrome c-type biogenesis protein CcsB